MDSIGKCFENLEKKNIKKAIEYGKIAIREYPDDFEPHLCLAIAYRETGELDLAYKHLLTAEELADNKEDLMFICDQIGQILSEIDQFDDAIFYYKRAYNLAKELNQLEENTHILSNLADAHIKKGEVEKAKEYLEIALEIEKKEENLANIYSSAGVIYSSLGNHQKAIEYLEKAMEINKKYDNKKAIIANKINIGSVYTEAGEYEKAEKYITEGTEDAKKIGDRYWQAIGYWSLGKLYKKNGNKKKAEEYLRRAFKLFKIIGATKDAELIILDMLELLKNTNT
ncbi:tetratricopeptide repeat protein [Sulfurihydrogenibium yellowstonense]|uniref:Putative G-protein-signaling modulator 2 n=1 Tax=Sulfurihydrogenibium yellowstonense SS-5 TaxID=432331 RepID=C4FJ86_9AQUI|nr:tetratricopeptide repeat protein [Sulfurihydrogenibium yellowstonense]EEP60864.1 putative G-protein-signaling modulator 2 [Sulfurihydrogenibium yellowstonense SS-5]